MYAVPPAWVSGQRGFRCAEPSEFRRDTFIILAYRCVPGHTVSGIRFQTLIACHYTVSFFCVEIRFFGEQFVQQTE